MRQPSALLEIQDVHMYNKYSNKQDMRSKITALLMVIAIAVVMLPQLAFADNAHDIQEGMQPEEGLNKGNRVCLLDHPEEDYTKVLPCLELIERNTSDGYYLNRITEVIDGTKDIEFAFTMDAGMNNFNKDNFLNKNMSQIKIYDEKEEKVVAAGNSSNTGEIKFLRNHLTEDINNHGSKKTDAIIIGVDQGVLATGTYVLVFGKDLCGNNFEKTLGMDVKFQMDVVAAPELGDMISKAEGYLGEITQGDEPGQYSSSSIQKLQQVIDESKTLLADTSATDEQLRNQSETLYWALDSFKDSINFKVSQVKISGIGSSVGVGSSGTATAGVSVVPDWAQYRKVTWSVVKEPNDASEEADNIIIGKNTGKWTASYSGTCYIKATSTKDTSVSEYNKVTVTEDEGVTAINLSDVSQRVSDMVDRTGKDPQEISALKVFTTDKGTLTDADVSYISKMKNLKKLDIGATDLTVLASNAFSGHASLEEVVLPEGLTTINGRAFYNCSSLRKIDLPRALTTIGGGAFAGCTSMDSTLVIKAAYPPTYTTYSPVFGDAFNGKDDDRPASVKTISVPYGCSEDYKSQQGWRAQKVIERDRCSLDVTFTESGTLADAAEKALQKKGVGEDEVTDLKISSPDGVQFARSEDVTNYLQQNFLNATTLDLSDTEFEGNKCNANVFRNRISLKHIILPDSTNNIGGQCFYGCKNLREIILPSSLTHIGSGAFGECIQLSDTIVSEAEKPPAVSGDVFPEQVKKVRTVPGSADDYENDEFWATMERLPMADMKLSASELVISTAQTGTLTADVKCYGTTEYPVYWESENDSVVKVSSGMGSKITVTGVKAGSADITATTARGDVTAICRVTVKKMDAPGSFRASSAAYNQIKVSWNGVSGAAGYEVFYSTSKSGSYTKKATLKSSVRSYTFTGLTTGKTYYFKVRGYKVESDSTRYAGDYTAVKSAIPTLSKQSAFKVKAGKKSFTASWKKVSGASGYTVYYSTKKSSGFKSKTVNGSSKVKYTVKSLKKGKTYYVKARAYRTVSGKKVYGPYTSLVRVKTK